MQINSYYPFGLNMEGNWNGAAGNNKYAYNGKEWNDDFGLGWNHHDWRFLDVAINRFVTIDRLPEEEEQEQLSPYQFGYDNPIRYDDPDGQCPTCVTAAAGAAGGAAFEYGSQVIGNLFEGKGWSSFTDVDGGKIVKAAVVGAVIGSGAGLIGGAVAKVAGRVANKADDLVNAAVKTQRTVDKAAKTEKVAEKTVSLEKQASNLVKENGGKNRVTLRTPNKKVEVDLSGKAHYDKATNKSIPTPHTKTSPLNPNAPKQPAFNSSKATTAPTTQQEIRVVRKYLEKQK